MKKEIYLSCAAILYSSLAFSCEDLPLQTCEHNHARGEEHFCDHSHFPEKIPHHKLRRLHQCVGDFLNQDHGVIKIVLFQGMLCARYEEQPYRLRREGKGLFIAEGTGPLDQTSFHFIRDADHVVTEVQLQATNSESIVTFSKVSTLPGKKNGRPILSPGPIIKKPEQPITLPTKDLTDVESNYDPLLEDHIFFEVSDVEG